MPTPAPRPQSVIISGRERHPLPAQRPPAGRCLLQPRAHLPCRHPRVSGYSAVSGRARAGHLGFAVCRTRSAVGSTPRCLSHARPSPHDRQAARTRDSGMGPQLQVSLYPQGPRTVWSTPHLATRLLRPPHSRRTRIRRDPPIRPQQSQQSQPRRLAIRLPTVAAGRDPAAPGSTFHRTPTLVSQSGISSRVPHPSERPPAFVPASEPHPAGTGAGGYLLHPRFGSGCPPCPPRKYCAPAGRARAANGAQRRRGGVGPRSPRLLVRQLAEGGRDQSSRHGGRRLPEFGERAGYLPSVARRMSGCSPR